MKVLILSASDISGGAARAAYRLHQGLQNLGTNSEMLVQSKSTDDETVIAPEGTREKTVAKYRHSLDKLPIVLRRYQKVSEFSTQWFPDSVAPKITQSKPDIINLHWINRGFLKIETIAKLKQPIVWTLHDMWPFTGGCHYDQECQQYIESCGGCPQLSSRQNSDLSHQIWNRKRLAWQDANLTIVTPSTWLADCAKSSSLFKNSRVEVVPNGLDIRKYKPIDKGLARNILNLPQDKKLILFCSINATSAKRKGFELLQPALQKLCKNGYQDQFELVVVGASHGNIAKGNNFEFTTHYQGKLSDDVTLALVYSAADVFVAPSTQDNLPNTVMEALACGTPSVAFNIGGMADLIEHQKNGILVKPFNIDEFSAAIVWALENDERHQNLCIAARERVEKEFSHDLQAHRYQALFESVIR